MSIKYTIFVFDLLGLGGIPTYTRYMISYFAKKTQDSKDKLNVFNFTTIPSIYKKSAIENSHNIHLESFRFNSRLDKFKAAIAVKPYIKKTKFIIINHINLYPFALIFKLLYGSTVICFGYNNDILGIKIHRKIAAKFLIDKLIVDSKPVYDLVKKQYKVNTYMLHDPVDLRVLGTNMMSKKNKNQEEALKLVTLGVMRMSANKGHRQILFSMKELQGFNIIYDVIGDGPDKKNIQQLTKDYKLESKVTFHGFISQESKLNILEQADIAILISQQKNGLGEGLPLGLIEAGLLRCALIAGNEDGSIDAISKIKPNGFLINPNSIKQLSEKIKFNYYNRTELMNHQDNSHEYCKLNFNVDKFYSKLETIINE